MQSICWGVHVFFGDLLGPCVAPSKVTQNDDLDILQALTTVLQTVKETEKVSITNLDQWPTYSAVIAKCKQENGEVVYQSQEVKNFIAAKAHFTSHYVEYCSRVTERIKARLSWSDSNKGILSLFLNT